MGKFVRYFFTFIGFLVIVLFVSTVGGFMQAFWPTPAKLSENSILHLNLDGIIIDGKDFLNKLKEYRDEDKVKAIVIEINSPGGVVGPSQEIFAEIKRTRDEMKKPVIVSCSGLAASGAYYAAIAADKIVTNPGTLMGSIGVIMEFANLEKLYDWARIHRYNITSGRYKDAGSESRPMTPDEKRLFQGLIDQVYQQFKTAVRESRKIDQAVLDEYTDGRIFTGEMAVKLGFADQLGTLEDAIRLAAETAGLGKKPKVFKPPRKHESLMGYFTEDAEGKVSQLLGPAKALSIIGKPLFLLPGTLGL